MRTSLWTSGASAPVALARNWPHADDPPMTTQKQVKNCLHQALAVVIDESLKNAGFARRRNSGVYTRVIGESTHDISFVTDCFPTAEPGADAYIHPHLHWHMKKVAEAGLAMVGGDGFLLATANSNSDLILNQPITFTAPKEKHEYWFATGPAQFRDVCEKIRSFISEWVLPFLADATSPRDLVTLYERNDDRVLKQLHWYVFIAAAYRILGEEEKAREVVRKHFSKPGIKARYGVLFKSLDME